MADKTLNIRIQLRNDTAENWTSKNPILLRIEKNAGHGAGRSTDQIIGENGDLLSFALFEMGIKSLKK